MLKKAGIIVAGSAAALLALSPLAFAGELCGHNDRHGHHGPGFTYTSADQTNSANKSSNSRGLVAIGDVNALNNLNVCPSTATALDLGGVLGLLGNRSSAAAESGDPTCVNDNSTKQFNLGG